jgi:hypothetical protein
MSDGEWTTISLPSVRRTSYSTVGAVAALEALAHDVHME